MALPSAPVKRVFGLEAEAGRHYLTSDAHPTLTPIDLSHRAHEPMLPRLEPEERLAKNDRLIVIAIGSVIFGAFALDVLSNFSWMKAGAFVMLVAWFGLIVVHELGHAFMALGLGWRVCRIVIGVGAPIA